VRLICHLLSMENPRPRSAGVTAAATFAILGCVSALCFWGYILLNLVNSPADEQGHRLYEIHAGVFLLVALVPPLALAACIRTAIGLFQLRPWARISAMLWAAVALLGALGLIAFRPFETFVIPEHFVREVDSLRQLFAIAFVFMLLPASVWWLFLFRMKSVKAQFGLAHEAVAEAAAKQSGAVGAHKAVI
jgi:uncharacterized protein YhhL (DUF1145 family)